MIRLARFLLCASSSALFAVPPADAQIILDRADPSITERSLPVIVDPGAPVVPMPGPIATDTPAAPALVVTPQAILVTGSTLPPAVFADVIRQYIGQALGQRELSELVSAVASTARGAGYPFATAVIEPQPLSGGMLRVRLDEGRIDAVRVVGTTNRHADALLSRALVTGRPVRRTQLERAIQLVGDIPGLSVRESNLVRQDGFTILLITVAADRASAYAQLDNRGSDEVGPIRSTVLANIRNVVRSGDEAALLLANTPLQPSEFVFLRGRYAMPLGLDGTNVTVAASYGRSQPGAALKALDVIGTSLDASLTLAHPFIRSRDFTVSGNIEFRHVNVRQSGLGTDLRHDRLEIVTASVDGIARMGGGTARGQIAIVVGLPFGGITRVGAPLASRPDGDGRFTTLGFTADWARPLWPRTTLVLSSAGQIASRPLLATVEIGAGGPGFGRGYDFAERTGDSGLLGSAELRVDTGKLGASLVERSHLFGFVDGGVVKNLGPLGRGGGSLFSTGGGIRFGRGRIDAMAEIALPLNADRFDTRDRRPRISLRLARSF